MTAGNHVLAGAPSWNLSSVGFFELFRGEPKQFLYRDIWKYGAPELQHEVDLNGMWAVTDFTANNGGTHLIPGSHLWHEDRQPDPAESIPAEMPKGSLLIYTGKTFYGGGPNTSGQPRNGPSVQHSAGWLVQTEIPRVECPPAAVVDWPDDLTRFIGYQQRGTAVGKYGDHEDPFILVTEARAATPTASN